MFQPCSQLSCALVLFLAVQTWAQSQQNAESVSSKTQNTLLDDVDLANTDTGDDSSRIRRSGITGLINKKLHFIGHLSGSSSGSSSHGSSGHHDHHGDGEYHHYETEHHDYGVPHYEHHDEGKGHKLFDYKKTILASLFQAVKAITGGVVALKGQVLKIGGHLFTWKGKFLVKKGDQITALGRDVASKALLSPPPVHHYHHPSIIYSPPTTYDDHSSLVDFNSDLTESLSPSFGSSAYASAQASHSSSHANEIYHHHAVPHHHSYVAPSYSAPTPTYSAPSGGAGYPYPPSNVPELDYSNTNFGSKVTRAASVSGPGALSKGSSQNSLSNEQLHAGLLILKPIQVPKDHPNKYQLAQQSLLKQASLSGININTAGNTGMNYNVNTYTPSQSNSYQPQANNYQTQTNNYQTQANNYQNQLNNLQKLQNQLNKYQTLSNNYQGQSNGYQGQSNTYNSPSTSYQGPVTSYGTPAPATSQFIKVPSASGNDYRSNNFPALIPTPLSDVKLPAESSPFDFLYNKNSKTSQERQDTKSSERERINENALSALNVLYQQTESQNKDQTRETRNTSEEPLNDETLQKILDALFSAKDKQSKATSQLTNNAAAPSASGNVETTV